MVASKEKIYRHIGAGKDVVLVRQSVRSRRSCEEKILVRLTALVSVDFLLSP